MQAIARHLRSAALALCLLAAACSSLIPPESCGPGTDGSADEAKFAELFLSMDLVNAETGVTGEPDEEGNPSFIAGQELQIFANNARALSVRACVQERRASGRIAAEREGALPAGRAIIPLGSFEEGEYVVRVIAERVLVRNLPFHVLEADD